MRLSPTILHDPAQKSKLLCRDMHEKRRGGYDTVHLSLLPVHLSCLALRGGRSLGKINRPRLADDGHLDLPWVLQVLLHSLGHVLGKLDSRQVVDLLRLDDDPDLPSRLDGIGFVHPVKGVGDLFQGLDPLDVGFQRLPPCPWAGP